MDAEYTKNEKVSSLPPFHFLEERIVWILQILSAPGEKGLECSPPSKSNI